MNCYKFSIKGRVFHVASTTIFKAIDCLFDYCVIGWYDLEPGDDIMKLSENEMIAMKVRDDKGVFINFLPDYLLTDKESVINVT